MYVAIARAWCRNEEKNRTSLVRHYFWDCTSRDGLQNMDNLVLHYSRIATTIISLVVMPSLHLEKCYFFSLAVVGMVLPALSIISHLGYHSRLEIFPLVVAKPLMVTLDHSLFLTTDNAPEASGLITISVGTGTTSGGSDVSIAAG